LKVVFYENTIKRLLRLLALGLHLCETLFVAGLSQANNTHPENNQYFAFKTGSTAIAVKSHSQNYGAKYSMG
jgi:hypothetical protein